MKPRRPLPPFTFALLAGVAAGAAAQSPALPAAAASAVPAAAAASAPRPAAAAPAARPQVVEIRGQGAADPNAERRRSTASRIIVGREEIDRMGDASLGEVLKRLPGVTIGGPPGRGGQISLRGMGSGYTLILIDGQRMPFGFSLDSIAPDQIERIEIMRAPVAEHGARAIAGIINVIMREDFKRMAHDLKFGGGAEAGRAQGGGSWIYSGQNDRLGYSLTGTAFRQQLGHEVHSRTLDTDAQGRPVAESLGHSVGSDTRESVFLNARLQFRLGPGHTLELQPFFNGSRTRGERAGTRQQILGREDEAYARSDTQVESRWQMARLNGTWLVPASEGGRWQLRFGLRSADSDSVTRRQELDDQGGLLRHRLDDGGQRETGLETSGKFSQLLADKHSVSAGWELQHSQRRDQRTSLTNGLPILTGFGDNLEASTLRLAAYAQDEWDWSKTFSFYVGLRWEGIETRSDSTEQPVRNRSSVLTPLAHMVWKFADAPRDQLRLSLTRSYRAPNTSQLIARPTVSVLYPELDRPNQPTHPDRAGNPALKPELAWGLDLALEHYLDSGGLLSANLFARSIDNLIRTVRTLESVDYASVPRWVGRPQNVGSALAGGLELEARVRAADLWATELPLTLRANGSLLWSRVDGVPGPDNRLDEQPRYTLNLGLDLPLRGTPLTLGGNFNFTPAFVVQQIDAQVYRQGVKRVIDGYALWRFSPAASARLSVSNASARDFETGTTTLLDDGSAQAQDARTRSYTTASLRFELRF